jgi:hypothetical protein
MFHVQAHSHNTNSFFTPGLQCFDPDDKTGVEKTQLSSMQSERNFIFLRGFWPKNF